MTGPGTGRASAGQDGPIHRLVLAAVVALLLLAAVPAADSQPAAEKARVGVIGITPGTAVNFEMFRQGLAQVGYTHAHDVALVHRHADGVPARLAEAAAELVAARVDVVLARGAAALAVSARATTTIPIVAVDLESDPIAQGYAKTLARPGGNVTGVFLDLPELSSKQLQLIREAVPGLARVALVGDPEGNAAQFRATERAAATFGIQVQAYGARTAVELDTAIENARRAGIGAVLIFSSPLVFYNRVHLAALARNRRLPSVSLFTEFAEAGGLLTYGPSLREAFRRCGVHVGKILKGAKPGELPIERPETFELVINLKTAAALGLTIPSSVKLRADQLIE